jgi:hypothetical protein
MLSLRRVAFIAVLPALLVPVAGCYSGSQTTATDDSVPPELRDYLRSRDYRGKAEIVAIEKLEPASRGPRWRITVRSLERTRLAGTGDHLDLYSLVTPVESRSGAVVFAYGERSPSPDDGRLWGNVFPIEVTNGREQVVFLKTVQGLGGGQRRSSPRSQDDETLVVPYRTLQACLSGP